MSFLDEHGIVYPPHQPIFDELKYQRQVDAVKQSIDEALAGFVGSPRLPKTQQQMEATARQIVQQYTEATGDHYDVHVESPADGSGYINVTLTPKGPGRWQEIFCKSCVSLSRAYHHGLATCPNCKSMDVIDAVTANARTAPRD